MRKQFRIIEVSRPDETVYAIQRLVFGRWWRFLRVPAIYFGFPRNWWRGVSVFDTEDDARDALYLYLNRKYPSPDYNVHVKDMSWFQK